MVWYTWRRSNRECQYIHLTDQIDSPGTTYHMHRSNIIVNISIFTVRDFSKVARFDKTASNVTPRGAMCYLGVLPVQRCRAPVAFPGNSAPHLGRRASRHPGMMDHPACPGHRNPRHSGPVRIWGVQQAPIICRHVQQMFCTCAIVNRCKQDLYLGPLWNVKIVLTDMCNSLRKA